MPQPRSPCDAEEPVAGATVRPRRTDTYQNEAIHVACSHVQDSVEFKVGRTSGTLYRGMQYTPTQRYTH